MFFPSKKEIRSPIEFMILLALKDSDLSRAEIMRKFKDNFETWTPKEGTIFPALKRLCGKIGNRFSEEEEPLIKMSDSSAKSKETFSLTAAGEKFLINNLELFLGMIKGQDEFFEFGLISFKDDKFFKLNSLKRLKTLLELHANLLDFNKSKKYKDFFNYLMTLEEKITQEMEEDDFISIEID